MRNDITEKEARDLLEGRIVYIIDVDWEGIEVGVDGKRVRLRVDWKSDDGKGWMVKDE